MGLGKVIVSFRKKWTMEQEDLAKAIGISKSYLSLIENDKRKPMRIIAKIAEYFEVPITYFLVESLGDSFRNSKNHELRKAIEIFQPALQTLVDSLLLKDTKTMELSSSSKKKNKKSKEEKGI